MTELLPCPFCGSPAVTNRLGTNIIGQIYCKSDDCFGPRTTAVCYEDSVAQWNARPRALAQRATTRDAIAETIWRAEYVRATGKERNVSWDDGLSGEDRQKYLFVADAVLGAHIPAEVEAALGDGYKLYSRRKLEEENAQLRALVERLKTKADEQTTALDQIKHTAADNLAADNSDLKMTLEFIQHVAEHTLSHPSTVRTPEVKP